MTFKTVIKFDESPILRELERVAIKRGMLTPAPIVKEAAVEESYASTGDLHEDVLLLVEGLRKKGFEKEASDLEDKANLHRIAETHLYRVIDEDGDDILDFAHPEGDVEIAPSSSGLGKIWTEQSAKKEFLRVVNKKPTGKYSSIESVLKEAAGVFGMHKEAQRGLSRKQYTTGKDISAARTWIMSNVTVEVVKDFILNKLLKDPVDEVNWQGTAEGMTDDSEASYVASKMQPETIKTLMKWASHGYDPSSIWSYVSSGMVFSRARYVKEGELDVFAVWSELFGAGIVKGARAGEISLMKSVMQQMKAGAPTAKDDSLGYELVTSQIGGFITNFDNLRRNPQIPKVNKDRARELSKEISGAVKAVSGLDDFNLIKQSLSKTWVQTNWADIQDANDLMSLITTQKSSYQQWYDALKQTTPWKRASANENIIRTAQSPPPPGGAQPGAGYKGPARGAGGNATRQNQEELDRLADALEATKAKANWVETLRNTGSPPNINKPDGKWGGKTEEALRLAEAIRGYFVEPKGTKGKTLQPSSRAIGGYTSAQLPPIVTNSPAQSNIAAIRALTNVVVAKGSGRRQERQVQQYDVIDGVKLTNRDLFTLYSYYTWLVNAGKIEPKFSPSMGEYAKPSEMGGWLNLLRTNSRRKAGSPEEGQDPKLAQAYVRDASRLWRQWNVLLAQLAGKFGLATVDQMYTAPVGVPISMLRMAGGRRRGAPGERPGAGSRDRRRGGPGGRGDREGWQYEGGEDRDPTPPISQKLVLSRMIWAESGIPDEYSGIYLNYRQVRRMSGPNFAGSYFGSGEEGDPNANAQAQKFISDIGSAMARVFRDWQRDQSPENLDRTMPEMTKWIDIWRRKFGVWSRQLAEEGAPVYRKPRRRARPAPAARPAAQPFAPGGVPSRYPGPGAPGGPPPGYPSWEHAQQANIRAQLKERRER